MGSVNQASDDVTILLSFSSFDAERFSKAVSKLFGKGASIHKVNGDVYLLTLKEGQKDLAIFKASFQALSDDVNQLRKALIVPSDHPLLYSFMEDVKDGECLYLFSLEKRHPTLYEETLPLILGVKRTLLDTMKCYIENNCSSRNTQNEMFVHFNTVDYRIRKCMQQLGMNLGLFPTRVFLYNLLNRIDCPAKRL